MKTLLVDDEQHCLENLSILIERHCPEVREIRTAGSVKSAFQMMSNYTPDILFLDISMPEQDGFHLLSQVDTSNISVVFVSAHDEFALRAIKCGPTAYLLKPVDIQELVDAVALVLEQRKQKHNALHSYQDAIENLTKSLEQRKSPDRICLSHASKLQIVKLADIVLVSSDNYYSTFILNDGSKIVMTKTLKHYEGLLGSSFTRVHRSHLVQTNYIKEFSFETSSVTLENGSRIPVSRRKVNDVVDQLKHVS